MVQKFFMEKIAFGSFTNNTFVPMSVTVFDPIKDEAEQLNFEEMIVVNNLDQDIFIYDPRDQSNPLTLVKKTGGAFALSKTDLINFSMPPLLRNESGSNATSGNVVYTLKR